MGARRNRWRSPLRFAAAGLGGVVVGVLGLAFVAGGLIYDYEDSVKSDSLPPVDVIVCLAGGKGRITAAADLWYRYWEHMKAARDDGGDAGLPKVPVLFLSGVGSRTGWATIARQIRPEVLKVLSEKDVVLESFSGNTDENAKWFANYANEKKWKRVLLVTSSYHMRRARFIFSRVLSRLGTIQIESFSVVQEPFLPWHWQREFQGIHVTMTEFLKWVLYQMFWSPEQV